MVKRIIFGDEVATLFYDLITNKKINIYIKVILLSLLSIVSFGIIILLLIVGVISILKHVSVYEILMGICCLSYSLYFIISFVKRIVFLIIK